MAAAGALTASVALALIVSQALAAKEVVAYFGTEVGTGSLGGEFLDPLEIAVNSSGAGPADPGDIYVVDAREFTADPARNRIQVFGQDDNGTPADQFDDTYPFRAAWGADVDGTPSGGAAYEICTVAADCKAGAVSGGSGGMNEPQSLTVDQDTGMVYVADRGNHRVNVYEGDGTFQRTFGFDVVAEGPGNAGTSYEVCVPDNGDTCKAGVAGAGAGQSAGIMAIAVSQPDGNPSTGSIFVLDLGNQRVQTYSLDGANPSDFGSALRLGPSSKSIAVDSRGIVYVDGAETVIHRYDSENANGGGVGFLDPIATDRDELQTIRVAAFSGQFKLTWSGDTTADLQFDASAPEVQAALEALPSIGPGDVDVQGGPGNSAGSAPYRVSFSGAFATTDVTELTVSNGTTPLSGTGATVETVAEGSSGPFTFSNSNGNVSLEVDPDSDGPGSDVDTLYVLRTSTEPEFGSVIYQLGPVNEPGLVTSPSESDDVHGSAVGFTFAQGLGLDTVSHRLFVSSHSGVGGDAYDSPDRRAGVYVLDDAGGTPTATLDSLSGETATAVTVNGTINPGGPPDASYRIEYSTNGTDWTSSEAITVGSQNTPQPVSAVLEPAPFGLDPGTQYDVRIVASRPFQPPQISNELTFTTDSAAPEVETVGSPVRTATTTRLDGRINPRGAPTTYHFEYGTAGPCTTNPCTSTAPQAVGSGNEVKFASQSISDLDPGMTYHYRVVADNGAPGSPAVGADRTLTTRANDDPLDNGEFPGPPGSDRAWEQVSVPDSGGNNVGGGLSFSDDGERAVYNLIGGAPITSSAGFNMLYSQRTSEGWISKAMFPPRDEVDGPNWIGPSSSGDLEELTAFNFNPITGNAAIWRLRPNGTPAKLVAATHEQYGGLFGQSADGSRSIAALIGSLDPLHPAAPGARNLYDLSGGSAEMISLLPGDLVAGCGVDGSDPTYNLPQVNTRTSDGWISPDGSRAFFPSSGIICSGPSQIYMRDLVTDTTHPLTEPAVSGSTCPTAFVKAVDDAVFLWTRSRLVAEDTAAPTDCRIDRDGDVYRYDLSDQSVDCVTCVRPGRDADVAVGLGRSFGAASQLAVAEDGSRLYFKSKTRLVRGAATPAAYRLDLESEDLAYVAPLGSGDTVSDLVQKGNAITPDGAVLIFASELPGLDQVNGAVNAGTRQYYRYDDRDRSLVCVSCPADGTEPDQPAESALETNGSRGVGRNVSPVDHAGNFAFSTPIALVDDDDNTASPGDDPEAGIDAYEWRDGQLLLVSDGTTSWPDSSVAPIVNGFSADGRDLFFTASAKLTPDAIDAYNRLYDARIGGGFEFDQEGPPPCIGDACQGPPGEAPTDEAPGSSMPGAGNPPPQVEPDCSKVEARVSKAKGELKKAKTGKAKARARKAVKRAKKALKACRGGAA